MSASTETLVDAVAASLADWWRQRAKTNTELFWDAYNALEYLFPDEADINQCDGCRRGLPIDDEGVHFGAGFDMIGCTADRYKRRVT